MCPVQQAAIARHEAAHAVMDRISVVPEGDSAGRNVMRWRIACHAAFEPSGYSPAHIRLAREKLRKTLLVIMAGPAAERPWHPYPNFTDLKQAREICRIIARAGRRQSLFKRYSMIAVRLTSGVLKPAITDLAAVLTERQEIDGWDAQEMITANLGIEDYWRADRLGRIFAA